MITNNELGLNESIPLIFSEDEYNRLSDFHEKVIRLFDLELFRREIPCNMQISWSKDGEGRFQYERPKDDDVCSLLHRLRPFILQGESAYFYNISNLLSKNMQSSQVRSVIKEANDIWSGVALSSMMQVTMSMLENGATIEQKILSDEFLDIWLNAYEYHTDSEKKKYMDALHKYFPAEVTKVLLVSLLIEKVKAISRLNEFVGLILGDQPEQTANFIVGGKYCEQGCHKDTCK
jgi:hypothetical protein